MESIRERGLSLPPLIPVLMLNKHYSKDGGGGWALALLNFNVNESGSDLTWDHYKKTVINFGLYIH